VNGGGTRLIGIVVGPGTGTRVMLINGDVLQYKFAQFTLNRDFSRIRPYLKKVSRLII